MLIGNMNQKGCHPARPVPVYRGRMQRLTILGNRWSVMRDPILT